MTFSNLTELIKESSPIIITIFIVAILIMIVNLSLKVIKILLLKRARSKRQVSNIKIFTRILNVILTTIIVLFGFFSYIGSWTSLGLVAGLLTASLGFALQRPITGVAAWIMVVLKRPFIVGDWICLGDVRGEVYDITLTHIYLNEIGGKLDNSLHSGRNVMIPNHMLFEQNIINYTLTNDYVLEEVSFDVTYESDLDKAIKIAQEIASKYLKEHLLLGKREITIRVKMEASSMKVRILFYAPVKDVYRISSDITKEIYDKIKKDKNVEIAYPHTEIVFKDKRLFRK